MLQVGLVEIELAEDAAAGQVLQCVPDLGDLELVTSDQRIVDGADVEADADASEAALVVFLGHHKQRAVEWTAGWRQADLAGVEPAGDDVADLWLTVSGILYCLRYSLLLWPG